MRDKPSTRREPHLQAVERRREKRQQASGAVTLHLAGTPGEVVSGELLDVSPSGFRIRHHNRALRPGLEVQVIYPWGEVNARIMWTREVGDSIESGFFIVSS